MIRELSKTVDKYMQEYGATGTSSNSESAVLGKTEELKNDKGIIMKDDKTSAKE